MPSTASASTPRERSASSTLRPESSDTSRSELVPPISTATRPNAAGSVIFSGGKALLKHCSVMTVSLESVLPAAARHGRCRRRPSAAAGRRRAARPAAPLARSPRLVDQHRIDAPARADRARQRLGVGADDRRFAGRIDLGQHQRVDARTARWRNRRTDRACGCSDAAGTRPPGACPASRRARRRTPLRAPAGGGRSRRPAARSRPCPARVRRAG